MNTMILIMLTVGFGIIAAAAIVLFAVLAARCNKAAARAKIVVLDGQAYRLIPCVQRAENADVVVIGEIASGLHETSSVSAQMSDQTESAAAFEAEPIFAEEKTAEAETGVVVLRRNEKVAYPEAYAALTDEQKGYIDGIIAYAEKKDWVKKVVNDRSASVYLGKKLVVRTLIKNGTVFARLTVQNNDFCAYADNAGLNLKEKPVEIKVDDAETAVAVRDIIDIAYRDLYAERMRREEAKKIMRREQRRLARERAKADEGTKTRAEDALSGASAGFDEEKDKD